MRGGRQNLKKITSYEELKKLYYYSSTDEKIVIKVCKLLSTTSLLKMIKYSCFISRAGVVKIFFDVSNLDQNTVSYFLMNLKCCLISGERYEYEDTYVALISGKIDIEKVIGWGVICGDSVEDKLSLVEIYSSLRGKINSGSVSFYICCSQAVKNELESHFDRVNWVLFESKQTSFPISKKKNFLLSNIKEDIFLVQHTRIRCSTDVIEFCFNHHFDFFSPAVSQGNRRYLDLIFYKMGRKKVLFLPFVSFDSIDYLMKKHSYYIDGALFVGKKSSIGEFGLDDRLCWGEAEDIEFCSRLKAHHILVDLIPLIEAKSISRKAKKSFVHYLSYLRFLF